jgi:uncharacterized protein
MDDVGLAPELPVAARVAESPGRGRGLFATRRLPAGTVIERAPVLIVPRTQLPALRSTVLDDYLFWWDEGHNACAFGWASLFNHACPANVRFRCIQSARLIEFTTVREIAAGEEMTINYLGDPDDPTPPWFEVR